ncbi:MAG: hypothetical protein ACJ8CR_21785 [Roseiflexaceae bacterium]
MSECSWAMQWSSVVGRRSSVVGRRSSVVSWQLRRPGRRRRTEYTDSQSKRYDDQSQQTVSSK